MDDELRQAILDRIQSIPIQEGRPGAKLSPDDLLWSSDARKIIAAVLAVITESGWTVVRSAEYEKLLEIRAEHEGRFPRCLVVKPERDRDLYVGWSEVVEAPAGIWTRAEAI